MQIIEHRHELRYHLSLEILGCFRESALILILGNVLPSSFFDLVLEAVRDVCILFASIGFQLLIVSANELHSESILIFDLRSEDARLLLLDLLEVYREDFGSFEHVIKLIVLHVLKVGEVVLARFHRWL